MKNISLTIPTDIAFEVKSRTNSEEALNGSIKLSLAIGMFVSQEITLAKAAELAEKSILEFIGTLKERGIPAFFYSRDMLEDDLKFAERA